MLLLIEIFRLKLRRLRPKFRGQSTRIKNKPSTEKKISNNAPSNEENSQFCGFIFLQAAAHKISSYRQPVTINM